MIIEQFGGTEQKARYHELSSVNSLKKNDSVRLSAFRIIAVFVFSFLTQPQTYWRTPYKTATSSGWTAP